MQARQDGMSVNNLFSINVQYTIPIYQRHYVWTKTNWSMLWEDIKEKTNLRTNKSSRRHFTGSIVACPGTGKGDLQKYEIIDGQQRLTTFQIILCVIRDICQSKCSGNNHLKNIAESADRHIKNEPHVIDNSSPEDQYKLSTTSHDEEAFQALVSKRRPDADKHRIYDAYDYFKNEIEEYVKTPQAIINLFESVIRDFIIVQIDLNNDDESERIFASLNATGKMLYEFDYLRNYLFLKAKSYGAPTVYLYNEYWIDFEAWDSETAEVFLWDFLKAKLGPEKCVQAQKKKDKRAFDLYREYSQTWGNNIESEFAQLKEYADSYRKIKNNNPKSEISDWMKFYDDLEIASLHPFLLFIVTHEKLNDDERNQVFAILESYIVRWMLCCGNNEDIINEYRYARIDGFFSKVIEEDRFRIKEFVRFLSDYSPTDCSPTGAWPTNEQVKDALRKAGAQDVNSRLIVYILYRIELLKRQGKPYQDADVQLRFEELGNREHIMPRKWSNNWPLPLSGRRFFSHKDLYNSDYKDTEDEWRRKRGQIEHLVRPDDPDYQEAYDLAEKRHDKIDSIGNLIPLLPDLNDNLANKSFDNKKSALRSTTVNNLQLTKEILEYESWDVEQILEREQDLCNQFFKVWQPAEYFLKSKSDKMIESGAHMFITNIGEEKKLTKIETFPDTDRVTGVGENNNKIALEKSHILFLCSETVWQEVKNTINCTKKIGTNPGLIQVKEWLLKSAQDTGNYVKAITPLGHVLRGIIKDFDAEAMYLQIKGQTVIIYKQSLHEFITEGRSFRRHVKSFTKKSPHYNYGFINFFEDSNTFHVNRSRFKKPTDFDSLALGSEVIFNIAQTEAGLFARDVVLVE